MKNYFYLLVCLLLTQSTFAQEKMDIFDVARKGTVAQAKELLKADPKLANEPNKDGFTALVLAIYRGNNEVAQFLINQGSDINSHSDMGTPLMAAIVKGNNEMAKVLIEKKANIDLTDSMGTTALIYATQFKNIEILKLLLVNKADKTKVDKAGKTAFEYATFSNKDEIINLLK